MREISWSEWERDYLPTSEQAFDTIADIPEGTPEQNVWTLLDDGERYLNLMSGFHLVNRLGYLVTRKAWSEETLVSDN